MYSQSQHLLVSKKGTSAATTYPEGMKSSSVAYKKAYSLLMIIHACFHAGNTENV